MNYEVVLSSEAAENFIEVLYNIPVDILPSSLYYVILLLTTSTVNRGQLLTQTQQQILHTNGEMRTSKI